jgi:DNA-binding transcriptional LysR family regulator
MKNSGIEKSASINDLTAFISVAQSQSFTKAAEQLASTKSSIGKAIRRLEAQLNARLLQRTTRAVRLTEDGEIYLDAAKAAVEGLNLAQAELAARRQEPSGRVRVDLAVGIGNLIIPTIAEFNKRYPRINLDIVLNDRQSNPVAEGWDLVIRIGDLPSDSGLVVRKLATLRNGLYASPEYLSQSGEVRGLDELRTRDGILFRSNSGKLRPWTVLDLSDAVEVMPNPSLIVSDGRTMIDAAVGGVGIAQIYDKIAQPYVSSGRLVHLLPEMDTNGHSVHAIIPVGRRMPARIRVVLEHISRVIA